MNSKTNSNFPDSQAILERVEELFEASDCILQDARNTIKKVRFEQQDYVVKSFKKPNCLSRIIYTFLRPSKARRSYQYSLKISQFVPQAVAFIEFRQGGLLSKSFFVSEMFDYDFTIREPLRDINFSDRDNLFKAFAKFSFALHQEGILHRDYSPGNILIKRCDTGYEFKIIDINRMSFGELAMEERMRSFKMLWASDEVLETIIQEYAALAAYDTAQCQTLAKRFNQRHKRFKNFKKKLKGTP